MEWERGGEGGVYTENFRQKFLEKMFTPEGKLASLNTGQVRKRKRDCQVAKTGSEGVVCVNR